MLLQPKRDNEFLDAAVVFALFAVLLSLFVFAYGFFLPSYLRSQEMGQGYGWREWSYDPSRRYLYQGNTLLGGYDLDSCYYRPYDPRTRRWGDVTQPPIPPPAIATGRDNQGVEASRISHTETYRLNGSVVSRRQAERAIFQDIPDDAKRFRLTVIGTEAERQTVLHDLHTNPALRELKDQLVVQDYEPSHWAVKEAGFLTTGRPTIYLQSPDGKVLHRQDNYDGPEALAAAIRKPSPDYLPERDRDRRRIFPRIFPDLPSIDDVPPITWLLVGAAALVYLRRNKT